jgi:hypothetical protein
MWNASPMVALGYAMFGALCLLAAMGSQQKSA